MAIVTAIDSVNQDDVVNVASVVLVESAEGGEIGQGGFDRSDYSLANVPALKLVEIDDADADPTRLFTGYTGIRGLGRGEERVGTRRQWDVNLWDSNFLLESQIFESGDDANRPAETDYERVTWLLGTSACVALGIVAGVVPNTNTVTLDATDYRGVAGGIRRVLSDCGEAAQKNYFLYVFDPLDGIQLYYDKHTGSSLTSTLTLSADPTDVDEATCWPLLLGASLESDPSNIWSTVRYNYTGGHVRRTDADAGLTTSTDFMPRETVVEDSRVKSAAKATAKADAYLRAASTEKHRFRCEVELPADTVNEIRAGMRLAVKAPHLTTADFDFSDFVYFRITRRELRPAPTDKGVSREWYRLTLEFADDVKITSFQEPREPGDTDSGAVTDGSSLSLTRYQLFERLAGPSYYSPAGMLWNDVPADFTFGTVAALTDSIVDCNGASYDITWPYADCGIVAGAWAGKHFKEAWYRFDVDLAGDETIVGVRFTIAAPTASLDAVGAPIIVGAAIATPTAAGQFTKVGVLSDAGGTIFLPASVLQDDGAGHCYLVLAPGWTEPYGFLWCGGGSNPVAGNDHFAPGDVTAVLVTIGGSGLSPWVSGVGDVDGSNTDFELPNWNGEGTPEARVGNTILGAGEYSCDAGTLVCSIVPAPPADMAGQVAFRFKMSDG